MADVQPQTWIWNASDGYPIQVATWHPATRPRARVVILHGVQSHQGWYHGLGRRLSERGFETHFPDRRGSGGNTQDRGHTPSWRRLVDDVGEFLQSRGDDLPRGLAGISWGGKLGVLTAAHFPSALQGLALICPGLHPKVGVSPGDRLRIALAYFFNRRKFFPVPLSDPALFTENPEAQQFIATDPLSLRFATAGLLAASRFIDSEVARVPSQVKQPVLLMLASEDRIVDNERTRRYAETLASPDRQVIEYPGAHHTLEFEPDPERHASDLADWMESRLLASSS